jgi:hypothetical protein
MANRTPPEERFWPKVNKHGPIPEHRPDLGPCWLWLSVKTENGYGRFKLNGKMVPAYRVAYELLAGPIPQGLTLDHLCRVPACVRPSHLEPVTTRENILRGVGVTARNAIKTHCANGHLFDEANTYIDAKGARVCRTCIREAQRRYKARRRCPR